MKYIYALYDKRADAIYNENVSVLEDYRAMEAAYRDQLATKSGEFYHFAEDFKLVRLGEISGKNIHIYEEPQTMRELVELLPKATA